MKFFALVAGAAAISRHHHSSHNYDSSQYYMVSLDAMMMNPMEDPGLMQNQPSHWRKQWPEGLTDQGQQDDTVVDRHGAYRGRKWTKPVPVVDYGHDLPLDGDIIDSRSILTTPSLSLRRCWPPPPTSTAATPFSTIVLRSSRPTSEQAAKPRA